MIEGSGSLPLTNGSGRSRNIRIWLPKTKMTQIHADPHPQHCSQYVTTDLVGAAVLDELSEDVIDAAEDLLPGGALLLLPPLLLLLLLATARLRDEHRRLTGRHHHLAMRSLLFYTVLRIHEIFGMVPKPGIHTSEALTNGSGSICGSCYFGQYPSRRQQKIIIFF